MALGVVHEARARRDALRSSFQVPPTRGTASSLIGGPAPRSAAGAVSGAGLTLPALVGRVGSGARRAAHGVNTAARQRVDRAFLADWRLATANGPQAQRMYAAGTTLEVAATTTVKPRTESSRGVGMCGEFIGQRSPRHPSGP